MAAELLAPALFSAHAVKARRDGPQLRPLKVLHRHDGYISFMVFEESELCNRFAIRADALDTWFPEFTTSLLRNSFVSINAGFTLADYSKRPYGTPKHESATLRYLCACYVDIDYHQIGLKRLYVMGELERLWENGELPEPSMVVDSGRGMWLLFLLHDEKRPDWAHKGAFADNPNDHLQLYCRINKALHVKLCHLGADPISDGPRHIRVPGSFRNDVEKFVKWRIHGDSDRVISYTLKELATSMGVSTSPRIAEERAALAAAQQPKGRRSKAWKKMNQNRLAALLTIMDQRGGGFKSGCRNKAAFFYAMALKCVGAKRHEAESAVIAMGALCDPPLSATSCRSAVKQGFKTRRPKLEYQTIANVLDVAPGEAEIVSQILYRQSAPGDRRFFPAAQRFGPLTPVTTAAGESTRQQKHCNRQNAIRQIISEVHEVLSVREMKGRLLSRGISVSLGSLHADYKALNLQSVFKLERAKLQKLRAAETQGVLPILAA